MGLKGGHLCSASSSTPWSRSRWWSYGFYLLVSGKAFLRNRCEIFLIKLATRRIGPELRSVGIFPPLILQIFLASISSKKFGFILAWPPICSKTNLKTVISNVHRRSEMMSKVCPLAESFQWHCIARWRHCFPAWFPSEKLINGDPRSRYSHVGKALRDVFHFI